MRLSLLVNRFHWGRYFLAKSLKKVCCILLMGALTACQTLPTQEPFKKLREQQQLELAELLDQLWLRAHILPQLAQGAPLVSTARAGQETISQQNVSNIQRARALLDELDTRVSERKLMPQTGDVVELTLSDITDNQHQPYKASRITLFRAEQKEWLLEAATGEVVPLTVIWNETGALYIEGQEVALLSSTSSEIPSVVEIFYYGDQVLAQASFAFTLQVTVPRL